MRSAARCACLNIISIRRLFEEGKEQAELEGLWVDEERARSD